MCHMVSWKFSGITVVCNMFSSKYYSRGWEGGGRKRKRSARAVDPRTGLRRKGNEKIRLRPREIGFSVPSERLQPRRSRDNNGEGSQQLYGDTAQVRLGDAAATGAARVYTKEFNIHPEVYPIIHWLLTRLQTVRPENARRTSKLRPRRRRGKIITHDVIYNSPCAAPIIWY